MSTCKCGCNEIILPKDRVYPNGRLVRNVVTKYLPGHSGRKYQRYSIDSETGCWNWLLGLNTRGYGQFQQNFGKDSCGKRITKTVRAHIYYWEEKFGKVPDGMELDHLCKNRKCCNPDHLEAVTHTTNMRRSSCTKLTEEAVDNIRILRSKGAKIKDIAELYDVHRTTIGKIVNNQNWKDGTI